MQAIALCTAFVLISACSQRNEEPPALRTPAGHPLSERDQRIAHK